MAPFKFRFNQWMDIRIHSNSIYCRKFGMKAGLYLMMYDQRDTECLLFKDIDNGQIIYKKRLDSPEDLLLALPSLEEIQKRKDLMRGGKSGPSGYCNHHIIPVHTWERSLLIRRAGVNMDGPDNTMLLPADFHNKFHGETSNYSKFIRRCLENEWNKLGVYGIVAHDDREEMRRVLLRLINSIRRELEKMKQTPGSTIKDW